jgi:hypothetical protein
MTLLISGMALSFFLYSISATNSTEAMMSSTADIYNKVDGLYMKFKQISSRQRNFNVECQNPMQACNLKLPSASPACNIGPQNIKCEPVSQVFQCVPVTQPYIRNPQCPVHGDQEFNHHVHKSSSVRSNKRNVY